MFDSSEGYAYWFDKTGKDYERKLPAEWTHAADEYYKKFLEGRVGSQIKCRFELADGTVIDGPCRLDVENGKSIITQVRPNKTPKQGFGLL